MNFKRMKTLLLELAIHGKLVPQMTEEGQVKSSIDGPFELPNTWGWRKFEDVLFFENGDRGSNYPAKSTLTRDPSSGHPFVSAINLNNGRICSDDLLYLSVEQKQKLRSGHIKAGDCLFCIRGSLGKFGFAEADGGAIASSLVILRKKDAATIREEFLAYVLQSPFFAQCIEDRSNGTAQPNLGAKELKGFPFPVPPLQEQARIVAKLEESLAEIDHAEKAYQELQTLSGVLRGQILQEAIQGKLVPQLAEEGGVEQIGSEPENEPFAIPESWKWLRVKDLAISVSTGPFGSMLHKSDYVEEGIPVVNPMNLVDGQIVPKRGMMVSTETADRLKTYQLKQGNIVVARRGELGRCAVVSADSDGWLCGTGSFFISLKDAVVPEYFAMCFGAKYMVFHLNSKSVGTTMANLNHGILKAAIIPVPPIREQIRILAKVANLMRQVDALSPR